nr:MAG TPA: hypothetical protein [Caudoviricetes sp.]
MLIHNKAYMNPLTLFRSSGFSFHQLGRFLLRAVRDRPVGF